MNIQNCSSIKSVCVVLSTYNGAQFIEQQLDSVLAQTGINIFIYIRDDGSTDATPKILKEYSDKYANVLVKLGNNIGFRQSFLKALADAPSADYYAFCDQDDYWFPNKISKTLEVLIRDKSNLAFCNAFITDEKLLGRAHLYTKKYIPSFPESISNSNCHGFLLLFDSYIRDLAVSTPYTSIDIPHDFWLITIATMFGKVSFEGNEFVALHRRLKNSVSNRKPISQFLMRAKSLIRDESKVSYYSKILVSTYREYLKDEQIYFLTCCLNYRHDKKMKKFLLASKIIQPRFKLKILLNKF